MTRAEFSKRTKVQAFERAKGACEICTAKLGPGNVEYDHILPDWLGGKGTLENCQCICRNCHRGKTRADHKTIAKAKRQGAAHIGAKKPKGRPLFGTKASGWRKQFNRPPERRE